MKRQNPFLIFLISAIFSFSPCLYGQLGPETTNEIEVFDSEKAIAVDAYIIANNRLAKNKKDKLGLTLVNFAHHLNPNYEPLLLLRGKLKYNLDITSPENEGLGDSEFLFCLKKRAKKLAKNNNIKDRHLCLIYFSIIRLFEPENEKALIQIMKFTDQGEEMNIDKLLKKKYSTIPHHELDPKDQRYAIGNVEKTLKVSAKEPWTDTWIKVHSGKIVRIEAKRFWTLGDGSFPYIDADGFDNISLTEMVAKGNKGKKDRNYQSRYRVPKFVTKKLKGQKDMNPGCLLAKIGKTVYPAGRRTAFRAESSGILSLGPFEWDSYNDNDGYLLVTVKISDK